MKLCNLCDQPAIQDDTLPYPLCEQHFAWLGMAKIRKRSWRERFLKTLSLFFRIVFRESPAGGRMGVVLSWNVARDVHKKT